MEKYRKILKQFEHQHASTLHNKHGLVCRQLPYGDEEAVLYVAKNNWTNRFDPQRKSTVGIFFSVWVTPELLDKQEFAYNIHSKQLRKLPGYRLTSKKFANDFRELVQDRVSAWPNIRLDYGPLTLLQGRDSCRLETFAVKVKQRVTEFTGIHEEIDNLLQVSKR